MKFKNIFFIALTGLWTVFQTSAVLAIDSYSCNHNPNNNLIEGNTYGNLNSISNSQGVASFSAVVKSPDLNKCDDAGPSGAIPESDVFLAGLSFYFDKSVNIDFNKSVTSNGKTYYGLKNTGSDFLNKFGFMFFKITGENGMSSSAVQKLRYRFSGVRGTANHGIQVDSISVSFFDTAGNPITGPKEKLDNISIDLGQLSSTLGVNWSNPDGYIILYAYQNAYITLNILPSLAESCSVTSETVQLPDVPAGNLRNIGDEIGGASFAITASCEAADAGKQLMYTMMDKNAPLTVKTNFLTNTVTETNNVGVAVYDDMGNKVITHNTTDVFGTLSGGTRPSVTKRFLARYHKLDNAPVKPGLLNAQATILVNYK
ncbi:fimbrial protein [Acinetobacter courvalinii]